MIFTSSDQTYADALIDTVDSHGCIYDRLYRRDLSFSGKRIVKDISRFSKDLSACMIIDDSDGLIKHRENHFRVSPFFGDVNDNSLDVIAGFLEQRLGETPDLDLRELVREYNEKFCGALTK